MNPQAADALRRLEAALREGGAPIVRFLAAPRSASEIASRLRELSLPPNDDMLALYGWHDGTDPDRSRGQPNAAWEIAPAVFFLSLDEATEERRRAHVNARGIADDLGVLAGSLWRPDWLPAFRAHHGELFALSATGGGVWSVDWVDDPVHLYPDLASLATRLAARLETGIYSASGTGGALREDFDLRLRLEGPARGTI